MTRPKLSYLNARYYDGAKAKFISQDPTFLAIGGNPKTLQSVLADPQNMNAYAYARNNPIILSRSDGLYPLWLNPIGFLSNSIQVSIGIGQ